MQTPGSSEVKLRATGEAQPPPMGGACPYERAWERQELLPSVKTRNPPQPHPTLQTSFWLTCSTTPRSCARTCCSPGRETPSLACSYRCAASRHSAHGGVGGGGKGGGRGGSLRGTCSRTCRVSRQAESCRACSRAALFQGLDQERRGARRGTSVFAEPAWRSRPACRRSWTAAAAGCRSRCLRF